MGLKTITAKKLTLKGIKPVGQVQWTRETFYLDRIVEPLTKESFFLEFSHLDTVWFEQFLTQFVQAYPEDIHIIQVERGTFHSSELLQVPEQVIFLFQPAHSQATFWDERSATRVSAKQTLSGSFPPKARA